MSDSGQAPICLLIFFVLIFFSFANLQIKIIAYKLFQSWECITNQKYVIANI